MAGENGEINNRLPVTIDELVICEHCAAEAAKLLGYGDVEAVQAKIDRADQELAARRDGLARALSYENALKRALLRSGSRA